MKEYGFEIAKIKNIVFDVGGILLGYRWEDMFKDQGVDKEKAYAIGTGIFDNPNWTKYDAGLISGKQMIDEYCLEHPEYEEEARWFLANAIQMRVLRPRVYDCVQKLKDKGYKLYILSNYSQELFELHTQDLPFRKLMDGEMVSYMVNEVKPNRGIYDATVKKFEIKPEESVFFDDRLDNVEGAKKCGFNGIHIVDQSEDMLIRILEQFINADR